MNLSGVDFLKRDLSRHNLTGSNFNGANLSGCDLSSSVLTGANLTSANITGKCIVFIRPQMSLSRREAADRAAASELERRGLLEA